MSDTLLSITGIAPSGAGIAQHQGFRVFVPDALPGETALAEVEPPPKGVRSAVARHVRIQTRSPYRNESPCPALDGSPACGGCPLGRLTYEGQIPLKENLLIEALRREGVQAPSPDPLIAPLEEERQGFRNKAVFYPTKTPDGWHFGMYAQGSHALVTAAADCPQLAPWMPKAVRRLADALNATELTAYDETTLTGDVRALLLRDGRSSTGTESLMTLVVRELTPTVERSLDKAARMLAPLNLTGFCVNIQPKPGNTVLGPQTKVLSGRGAVTAEIDGLGFSIRSETFLQVNTPQTERLYHQALKWAEIGPQDVFLDLYCGVGTMTLLGAKRARSAVGVEIVEASVERARQNAHANKIENTEFFAGPVESVLPGLLQNGLNPTVAIVDPAFKGMDESVPSLLTSLSLKRLVYVSCSPASFARDAVRLIRLGWTLQKIGTVDLFPGALHIETVALFVRSPKAG